jgi:hypothetical protein
VNYSLEKLREITKTLRIAGVSAEFEQGISGTQDKTLE